MRLTTVRVAVCFVLTLGAIALPASGAVTGACHVSPVVADLQRSIRFYRDVLGLELASSPAAADATAWQTDAALLGLHGLTNARMRAADLRVPGSRCGIQLVEFETRDRRAVRLRIHDPGAVTLILLVRDMDAAFARVKAAQVPVITTGGAPVMPSSTSKTRAVIVTDPDGHFVELAQLVPAPATTVPAASNIFDIRFRITVDDMERSITSYRDHLGIVIKPGAFQAGPGVMAMMGLPDTAEYSVTMTPLPGSTLIHEFLALRGIGTGTRSRARVQDPGAYRLELAVDDFDATLAAWKSGGSRVLTTGGAVRVAGGRAAAVQDLNNLVLVLREASR